MHDHLVQHLESRLPSHEVQAVYNVLLSPANLHVWGKTNTPSCLQCSGSVSLKHLLRSCPKALADRRYTLSTTTRCLGQLLTSSPQTSTPSRATISQRALCFTEPERSATHNHGQSQASSPPPLTGDAVRSIVDQI